MDKYVWAESSQDYWPQIKTISAKSYNDAVENVINKYGNELDDDKIYEYDNWNDFREYLNDTFFIALSDLEMYEEL